MTKSDMSCAVGIEGNINLFFQKQLYCNVSTISQICLRYRICRGSVRSRSQSGILEAKSDGSSSRASNILLIIKSRKMHRSCSEPGNSLKITSSRNRRSALRTSLSGKIACPNLNIRKGYVGRNDGGAVD